MAHDVTFRSKAKKCGSCGTEIGNICHLYAETRYICESCFLRPMGVETHFVANTESLAGVVEAFAAALDAREHETGLHSKRVACHTLVLARGFTNDAAMLQQVYWGALLHDIGKIGIPDAILEKAGPLDNTEWRIMRRHPEIGYSILSSVPFMTAAAEIVLNHEEHYDGTGYPNGISGNAIPLWARLFSIIDTLDAMTSDRPYHKGVSFEAAKTEIVRMSGKQFDPQAVTAFLAEEKTLEKMVMLKCIDHDAKHNLYGVNEWVFYDSA